MRTPCIGLCRVDPSGELCLGCFRTVDEVCAWRLMTDEARAAVTAKLGGREREWKEAGDVQPDGKV